MIKKSPALSVLVVDDEPLIRWSVAETLSDVGYAVSEASDAKETMQRLSTEPTPDVILLDYRLPDSNDLTLLERVRQMAPESPVIMITAHAGPALQIGALERGAYRVLSKPFEMQELPSLV